MTRRSKITRIDVLSTAMTQGALLALIMFIFAAIAGLIFGIILLLAPAPAGGAGGPEIFGGFIGIIVMMIFGPLFYGAFGFIMGALSAFFYNIIAKWTGGIELEFMDRETSMRPEQLGNSQPLTKPPGA